MHFKFSVGESGCMQPQLNLIYYSATLLPSMTKGPAAASVLVVTYGLVIVTPQVNSFTSFSEIITRTVCTNSLFKMQVCDLFCNSFAYRILHLSSNIEITKVFDISKYCCIA